MDQEEMNLLPVPDIMGSVSLPKIQKKKKVTNNWLVRTSFSRSTPKPLLPPKSTGYVVDLQVKRTTVHDGEQIGVRDLVARGYFIPGLMSQRGGWSGGGVPCSTLSDKFRGQALMGEVGSHWVPRVHVRVQDGPIWVRISVVH